MVAKESGVIRRVPNMPKTPRRALSLHGDNSVTFTRYLKQTMEHGHAIDRRNNFYTFGYRYQSDNTTDFLALPQVADRLTRVKTA